MSPDGPGHLFATKSSLRLTQLISFPCVVSFCVFIHLVILRLFILPEMSTSDDPIIIERIISLKKDR